MGTTSDGHVGDDALEGDAKCVIEIARSVRPSPKGRRRPSGPRWRPVWRLGAANRTTHARNAWQNERVTAGFAVRTPRAGAPHLSMRTRVIEFSARSPREVFVAAEDHLASFSRWRESPSTIRAVPSIVRYGVVAPGTCGHDRDGHRDRGECRGSLVLGQMRSHQFVVGVADSSAIQMTLDLRAAVGVVGRRVSRWRPADEVRGAASLSFHARKLTTGPAFSFRLQAASGPEASTRPVASDATAPSTVGPHDAVTGDSTTGSGLWAQARPTARTAWGCRCGGHRCVAFRRL